MIKGIFFDLGGTLYSYDRMEAVTRAFLEKFARHFQVNASAETLFEHYFAANKAADIEYANQRFYLFRDYFETIFKSFMQRLELEQAQHDFAWFEEQQINVLIDSLRLKDQAHATLSALKSRGHYLSIVSNSDEDMLRRLIERAKLEQWLDHWTSSEAAQSCKPDSRFFEIALEKSGLVPEEVVFVGDSIEQDVRGAHNAGMTTVLIEDHDSDAPMHIGAETVEPNYRISDLSDLIDIVDSHER